MKTSTNAEGHTIWHFTRAELVALLAHMSQDETRANLCGLALDVEKGRASATDGHRAAMLTTGDRIDHDRGIVGVHLVPRDLLEKVVKVARASSWIMICCADGRVKVSVDSTAIEGAAREERPAPLDKRMPVVGPPGKHKGTAQAFNGWYLADIALICSACPPLVIEQSNGKKEKRYPGVILFPGSSDLDPMLADVQCPENQCHWRVVLMPMRI